MKIDKLTPYGDRRLQRINARPSYVEWTKTAFHDRNRDCGIAGLKENFSRDRGIEEPCWRPSK